MERCKLLEGGHGLRNLAKGLMVKEERLQEEQLLVWRA